LESEQSDVKDGVSRAKEAGNKKQNQLAQARRRLDNLDSQAGKQGAKLKGISHDSARAWEWIQEHQDEFERHVFGPPIIECSVTDPKYADQIESLFQRNDLLAFTCQSTADFKRLGTILYDNLKLAEINIQMCSESLESFRAPVSRDQMGQLGFTGWALDFLQGPDQVLSMLCGQSRIHATGVANEDFGDAQFEIIKNSPISSWVTNKQTFMIRRRREYGPDATSTSMRDIKPAQVWTDQPVDLTAKRELQGNIHNWTGELQAHAQEFQQGKDRVHQLATEIKALREEEQLLKSEKEERQKAITQWKGIPTRIETEKEKLQACHDTGRQVQERIAECDGQIQVIKLERAQAAIDYAAAVEVLQQLHVALYEAEIAQIEAVSDVQTLTIRSRDTQDLLITRRKELEVLEANRARMQALAKERMKTLKEIMSRANEQQTTFLSNLSEDQTLQDLENEIDSDRARLDLTHEGNTNVLAEFGHREETIRRHKERLEENEAQLSNLTRAIEEVRSKWEPELDRLVFEISAAFSRSFETIGCAGQIDVLKPDNEYAAWAIRIWVKFRENETMCVLDSQRQSGGERAVSTIFYLMSLQSLAQSPFRVVDEINQGMDPRNERLVHERMVDIACRENTSQYFLITPKLLSGLKYHERMRVMCIASGEYMPPKGRELDFRRCVDLARRIKGAA
jgi:chromosome segregation ATPase